MNKTDKVEYRFITIPRPSSTEARAKGEDSTEGDPEKPVIEGYAAVFESPTDIGGYFTEVIERGAFARAIKEKHDVIANLNHDNTRMIGRSTAGTLELKEDEHGLKTIIHPVGTTAGRDAVEDLRAGNISQMSFAFIARSEEWREDPKTGTVTRTVKDVDLYDVALVTFPAYEATSVKVRERAKEQVEQLRAKTDPEPETKTEDEAPDNQAVSYSDNAYRLRMLEIELLS